MYPLVQDPFNQAPKENGRGFDMNPLPFYYGVARSVLVEVRVGRFRMHE